MGTRTQRSAHTLKALIQEAEIALEEAEESVAYYKTRLGDLEEEHRVVKARAASRIPGTDEYRALWEQYGQLRLEAYDAENKGE